MAKIKITQLVTLTASFLAVAAARSVSPTVASGVTGTILAAGPSSAPTHRGPSQVTMREIRIPPGGSTGWHYHDGELIVVVKTGTLTRTLADCSTITTEAGESIFEPSGADHVHVGKNVGTEPVVLYVTYVLPLGSPLAHDVDAPACDR
jgi:quercetin dioxygenase-like cupin family protein